MKTHDNIENDAQATQPTQENCIKPTQVDDTQPAQEQSVQEPLHSDEEWREMIRRAEEEGYLRGLNERASTLMAEPAPYEPVGIASATQEKIPFLETIRRSVWDD